MDQSEIDACIKLAVDERNEIRARAFVTFCYLVVIFTISGTLWSVPLNLWPPPFFFLGAVAGIIVGTISSAIIARQKTADRAKDMQFAAGAIFGVLGTIVGASALLVWIVRSMFFS